MKGCTLLGSDGERRWFAVFAAQQLSSMSRYVHLEMVEGDDAILIARERDWHKGKPAGWDCTEYIVLCMYCIPSMIVCNILSYHAGRT